MSASTLRLHISPFSKDLFDSVLPVSVAAEALNVSYHAIQTFPENNYGYVELPQPRAEKLKKKLNGAILRGQKMRVEDARPAKRRRGEVDPEEAGEELQQKAPKSRAKKPEKQANVVEGRELSPDRKIKRGWTQAEQQNGAAGKQRRKKDKTDRIPSKYSEQDEVLFRTKVPPNKVMKGDKKPKKRKQTSEDADLQTVHEFKNSTKQPTFLKATANSAQPVSAYVEGKGWVDKDGTMVEAEDPLLLSRQRTRKAAKKSNATPVKPMSNDQDTESTSSSGSEDSVNSAPTYSQPESAIPSPTPPDQSQSTTPPTVHPLEALFKVPSKPTTTSSSQEKDTPKPSLELSTSFHFFSKDKTNNNPDLEDEEEEPASIPLTPYSSQDFRSRRLRSAAPTPDTAHPSRLSSYERNMPPAMRLASSTSRENDADDDDDDDEANEHDQTLSAQHPYHQSKLHLSSRSTTRKRVREAILGEARGERSGVEGTEARIAEGDGGRRRTRTVGDGAGDRLECRIDM